MSSARCSCLTLLTLLLLVCGLSSLSFAQGQRLGNLDLTAQANLSGTPMVGVDYALTDSASVRLSLGYFQFGDTYSAEVFPCLPGPTRGCEVHGDVTTYQYGGSVAGLYRLLTWNDISAYMGGELQYLYARSSDRSWYYVGKTGYRLSFSHLVGLSIRPVSWLSVFGEMGLGLVRGFSVQTFRADLDSNVSRWGITHISPGLRVSL